MRIAVVGATGNAGTAVLRALAEHQDVDEIIGIARRIPDFQSEIHHDAQWHSVDIQFPAARQELTDIFRGVDSVIHLAWLIQPNTERELLRRTNVDGTRYVLEAAAQAGVNHVVVASSVGAYSPVHDNELRDESWPTAGIAGSHYSVDKAAQERVMDEFVKNHPEVTVARMRSALKFQDSAGAEIQRYFLGGWVPTQLLRFGRPPMIPFPKEARTQAVHADDMAQAYVLATVQRADGAFNICADDILDAGTIGGVVTGNPKYGRVLPIPSRPLRPMVKAAHRAGLLAADEGWLDLAVYAPLLDNTRAKNELGWRPTKTGAQALDELLEGMAKGKGTRSAPLRPRRDDMTGPFLLPSKGHRLPADVDALALRQYLADHLAGATAGQNRIDRLARAFRETPVYAELASVAEEIRVEHNFLQELIKRQGFPRPGLAAPALWIGERAARIKSFVPTELKLRPSVLTFETELMMSAVIGKLHGWRAQRNIADALGVPHEVFDQLIDMTERQLQTLGKVHQYARERAFRPAPEADITDAAHD